jgi:hypothetical protein
MLHEEPGDRLALSADARMRRASVSMDRMIIQDVLGSSCVPKLLRSARTGATIDFAPTTPPATRSE